jgi:GT2 family glycosyltransferase
MDTDQIYPYDYLDMMLDHKEPYVSALNVARYYPFDFCCYNLDGEDTQNGITIPRIVAIQPPEDKRIFECDIVGTGALMIDPEVLNKIKVPYFKDIFDEDGVRLTPDDFYFSWKMRQAGFKPVVDQNIIVKHIAKMVVAPQNVRDLRRAWQAVNSGHGYWKDGKK